MSVTALQAAKRACEASGWTLTNLQLQKILYLAHMIYAGREGNPRLVADEDFEAWAYGPVLPSVYRQVAAFGDGPIKNVFNSIESMGTGEQSKLIDEGVKKLSNVPPFKLVEYVHDKNSAWRKHYVSGVRHVGIPHESVVSEYAARSKALRVEKSKIAAK